MGELLEYDVRVAVADETARAVFEYDNARTWLDKLLRTLVAPLAVETWVFNPGLDRVVLVKHRWRGWVPPGGKAEPGEMPCEAAKRELVEETGLRVDLHPQPAAVAVRAYHPDWPPTLGLSYAATADSSVRLRPEPGQDAAWQRLTQRWASVFPEDIDRMRDYARWLREGPPTLVDPAGLVGQQGAEKPS